MLTERWEVLFCFSSNRTNAIPFQFRHCQRSYFPDATRKANVCSASVLYRYEQLPLVEVEVKSTLSPSLSTSDDETKSFHVV